MKPQVFLKKIQSVFKKPAAGGGFHISHSPARDWEVVVGCGAALLVCFVIVAYLFFQKVNSVEIFQVEKTATNASRVFDSAELKSVTNLYATKKAQFDGLRLRATKAVDPSL